MHSHLPAFAERRLIRFAPAPQPSEAPKGGAEATPEGMQPESEAERRMTKAEKTAKDVRELQKKPIDGEKIIADIRQGVGEQLRGVLDATLKKLPPKEQKLAGEWIKTSSDIMTEEITAFFRNSAVMRKMIGGMAGGQVSDEQYDRALDSVAERFEREGPSRLVNGAFATLMGRKPGAGEEFLANVPGAKELDAKVGARIKAETTDEQKNAWTAFLDAAKGSVEAMGLRYQENDEQAAARRRFGTEVVRVGGAVLDQLAEDIRRMEPLFKEPGALSTKRADIAIRANDGTVLTQENFKQNAWMRLSVVVRPRAAADGAPIAAALKDQKLPAREEKQSGATVLVVAKDAASVDVIERTVAALRKLG